MKKVLFLIFIVIGFSSFAFSQTDENEKKGIEISICQPTLTEAGRSATFAYNYIYRFETDTKGLIKEVKKIMNPETKLMDDKDVIPCIKKWKLKPSEKYMITIYVGTTGEHFMLILGKEDKIKINL